MTNLAEHGAPEVNISSSDADIEKRKALRLWIPLAWGVCVGAATFALSDLASFFPEASFRGHLELPFMVLISPGLFVGMAVSHNVHAFSLVPAAIANFVLQFFIARSICKFISRRVSAKQNKSVEINSVPD
jgi:hypothetical protein